MYILIHLTLVELKYYEYVDDESDGHRCKWMIMMMMNGDGHRCKWMNMMISE